MIIKNINPEKATGPDKILPEIVRFSVNIIDSHLINIINNDINSNYFSNEAKVATVGLIYKKKVATKLKIIYLLAY